MWLEVHLTSHGSPANATSDSAFLSTAVSVLKDLTSWDKARQAAIGTLVLRVTRYKSDNYCFYEMVDRAAERVYIKGQTPISLSGKPFTSSSLAIGFYDTGWSEPCLLVLSLGYQNTSCLDSLM
jgi:hypothetical protein